MNKTGILLLPGGGMSSWIWKKLVPLLENNVVCPDYRIGENSLESRMNSSIQDCLEYLLSLSAAFESVIVVAHSGSGLIAASLARKNPKKIAGVIYISSNIPKNHTSAIESLPYFVRQMNVFAIKSQVKKESLPLSGKASMVRKIFCNTCDDATIEFVLRQRLLSEPLCMAFEKVNWDNFPQLSQKYIILTNDKTHSVKHQKQMMENLQITDSVFVDSDHMVMLSHPEQLAKIIIEFQNSLQS